MARPRPIPATRSSLAARATRSKRDDWRTDAVVVRLTSKLHELVAAAGRRSAETAVAIGSHLARIRDRLPHGQWRKWIEDNASFGRSTAGNYIELAAWAEREPAEFARLRHLGPGKLYVLAAAPPPRVRVIRPAKLVAIPGTERRKTIEHMTTVELASVVGDIAQPEPPRVGIEKVVQTVRFKAAALGAAVDVMLARVGEVDRGDVDELRAELSAVVERIDAAFSG